MFSFLIGNDAEMTILPPWSNSGNSTHVLKVERPYYEQEQFNNELNYCKRDNGKASFIGRFRNVKMRNVLLSLFPIFSWLGQYNVKSDLIGDLISGCTVAIMHIPQGYHTIVIIIGDLFSLNCRINFVVLSVFYCCFIVAQVWDMQCWRTYRPSSVFTRHSFPFSSISCSAHPNTIRWERLPLYRFWLVKL